MNKRLIYVIMDTVSKQLTPLFIVPNKETAVRQFREFLKGITTSWADYDLYEIGELGYCGNEPDESDISPCITGGYSNLEETGIRIESEHLQKLKVEES